MKILEKGYLQASALVALKVQKPSGLYPVKNNIKDLFPKNRMQS